MTRKKDMSQEIEHKFLLAKGPDGRFSKSLAEVRRQAFKADRIAQGYISKSGGNTVRVRLRDGKGYLTIKGPSLDGGLSRYEWEKEIPYSEAQDLLKLCGDKIIDKTRYLVKEMMPDGSFGPHVFEVDEYYGANQGLATAEVELSSKDEAFELPSWVGEEVTSDRSYSNASLSVNPKPVL